MIDLIISATVGAIAGSAIMRRIDLRKMAADLCGGECAAIREQNDLLHEEVAEWVDNAAFAANEATTAQDAHARATDRGNTLQARIDRLKSIASSQKSVKSARIVAVLEGDA